MANGDFPQLVRNNLKAESGGRCCAPWCGRDTDALDSSGKKTSVGEAAHICGNNSGQPKPGASPAARTAARPASARYDSTMTNPERADFSNGLWMCRNHHKLIDSDPGMYPVALLRQWKRAAGETQRARQATDDLPQYGIFTSLLALEVNTNVESLRDDLDRFVQSTGLSSAWGGDMASHVSGLWAELALNAFTHAAASTVSIKTTSTSIMLEYQESAPFGDSDLRNAVRARGGAGELKLWDEHVSTQFALTTAATGKTRIWVTTNRAAAPNLEDPCTTDLLDASHLQQLSGCASIHVACRTISLSGSRPGASAIHAAAQTRPVLVTLANAVDRKRLLALLPDSGTDGVAITLHGEVVLYLAPAESRM